MANQFVEAAPDVLAQASALSAPLPLAAAQEEMILRIGNLSCYPRSGYAWASSPEGKRTMHSFDTRQRKPQCYAPGELLVPGDPQPASLCRLCGDAAQVAFARRLVSPSAFLPRPFTASQLREKLCALLEGPERLNPAHSSASDDYPYEFLW